MQHHATLHEIARIELAEAARRAERVGPHVADATLEEQEPARLATLRVRVAEKLGRAARARAASLPDRPAA